MCVDRFCYRKVPHLPVYYRLDPYGGTIESLKDWEDKPKQIDEYIYFEEFAINILTLYQPISAAYYDHIRSIVLMLAGEPNAMVDQAPVPGEP